MGCKENDIEIYDSLQTTLTLESETVIARYLQSKNSHIRNYEICEYCHVPRYGSPPQHNNNDNYDKIEEELRNEATRLKSYYSYNPDRDWWLRKVLKNN